MSERTDSLPDLRGLRIAVVNPYLEGREKDCERNLYPRSHLWGADALAKAGAEVEFVSPAPTRFSRFLGKLSRMAKGRLGNLDYDWELIRQSSRFDLVYVAHGVVLGTQLLRMLGAVRAPVVLWTYLPPQNTPLLKLRNLHERLPFSAGIDALLCLTRKAETLWKEKWPGKKVACIDWGADAILFPGSDTEGEFFFACGRTNRDYATLLEAAVRVPAQFVILASRSLVGDLPVPENVRFVEGPENAGTDRGISYEEMIEKYYARAKAVLISRKDIADDTSGLTNLLEALAMGRPVAITRTGSLDLDVEAAGVGQFVPPGDSAAWADLLNQWLREPDRLAGMRRQALQMVREHYNHERHGRDVAWFVHDLLGTRSGGKP